MSMPEGRRQLRQQLRQRRREIPAAMRIAAADRIASRLLALPFAPKDGHVAGYWALDGEIALHAWQLQLPRAVVYCLPVLRENNLLHFAPWSPGVPLITNRYGIPEPGVDPATLLLPEHMKLVVVPLVGFDNRGARLGMGAGYYDRSFAFRKRTPPPPWLVGAGFAAQQVDKISSEDWDVGLDAICTEQGNILCNGKIE